jgi:hypothetical protein
LPNNCDWGFVEEDNPRSLISPLDNNLVPEGFSSFSVADGKI